MTKNEKGEEIQYKGRPLRSHSKPCKERNNLGIVYWRTSLDVHLKGKEKSFARKCITVKGKNCGGASNLDA